MFKLPNVSLISVACTKVDETIWAMRQCMKNIEFTEVILFTHEKHELSDIQVVNIEKLDYDGYNKFVAYELGDKVHTEYVLLVQNDGYITRPELWDNDFYNYDYIGAPWPTDTHFTDDGTEIRVGNGGFSFRSRKLLRALKELNLPFTDNGTGFFHEDGLICNYHRNKLEEYGIKYAPVEVAAKFSHELEVPESVPSFGFHRYVN